MPMTFTFNGTEPVEVVVRGIAADARTTTGDILYALNRQKTRIVSRTLRGVDVNGSRFEPYSEHGPFYWYPGKSAKNRSAAASRMAKKTGGKKTRVGIKFDSYGAFKRALGRSVVDLQGASAPHMLQAIVVKVGGVVRDRLAALLLTGGISSDVKDSGNPQPASEGVIGIYGPEAERADAHNTGQNPRWRREHRREFFGISESDANAMADDIEKRITTRIRRWLN